MTYERWVICALLFFATVIAYVDRAVIANLKNTLEGVIPGLNDYKYGIITVAFQLAYGIAMLVAGGLTDKLGTRKAFAIAICLWSVAAMLPGAAFSVASFALAMFLLGLGEAANFPACIKTVAEWFPKRERALRYRNLQLRRECRQHGGARRGRGVRGPFQSMERLWTCECLARLIFRRRRIGLCVAYFLAHCLSPA